FSRRSLLSTATSTSYVTTFCTVTGELRTWETRPPNGAPGYASTVNSTSCPTATPPMSDSLTLALTSIFVRSVATRKSVGGWKLAATVWPTETLRDTTTPSTGETMRV